ncbi:MAG: hypothetical protein IKS31_05720 [Clostridia bacterium]|nr:hypothetical protein [Clostridia bacterium]
MKATLKKISDVCRIIFGYGIEIVLFVGGLTFFGYMAAVIIGGETATNICTWISKSLTPVIIYASTILILFGLLTMYLAGEKALTPDKRGAKHEGEK